MKRILTILLLIGVAMGGGLAYEKFKLGATEAKPETTARPPARGVPVLISAVTRQSAPIQIDTIGTVQPLATITVKSRIDGQITKVHFKDGQEVKQGDVLFTFDARAMEAQLRQAEALIARDRAQLANAKREADRLAELVAKNIVSQTKYDEVKTSAASLEATVKANEAAAENIRVQLTYTTITSPIDGRVGVAALKAGSNVKANDTISLVTINQIHPVYVSFSAPQRDLPEIRRSMKKGDLKTIVQPVGQGATPEEGKLAFIDNTIDIATGTITLKSLFDNLSDALWPGQFVNVRMVIRDEPDALVVPGQAVLMGQAGTYVYIVKDDQTVEPRNVTVSRTVGETSIIKDGLKEGDKVVVDGQLRLTKGTKIEPKPYEKGKPGLTS